MKNLFALLFLFWINIAHSQKSFSLGGGLEYDLTTEVAGVNIRAYHNIGEHFCFGPELSVFIPKTTTHNNEEEKVFVWEVNFNAHYIFEVSEKIGIYPILGLNFTREREEISFNDVNIENEVHTENLWGVNLGLGFHVPLNNIVPFAEAHYTSINEGEYIITIGAFAIIGKASE